MSSAAEHEPSPPPAPAGDPAAHGGHPAAGLPASGGRQDAGGRPEVWPGSPHPLGATFRGGPDAAAGTGFALWAGGAEAVELCLFAPDGSTETRLELTELTDEVWHGFVPGVEPGRLYGYRVHGRWDPWTGHRFNPAKLLLDPYARAVDDGCAAPGFRPGGDPAPLPAEVYGHVRDWPDRPVADTVRDNRDSAPHVPKAVVVAPPDEPAGPRPHTPWADTVLYELHVRGFTRRHPGIPPQLRGTYAGLAHPAAIEHLLRLGVTAVELLPVHHFAHEEHLLRLGLRNHWGYNTLAYFAPHAAYSSSGSRGGQVGEFRRMVRTLHEAGLEVILDVVYNHTAEGGELGPTLSLRGIDNRRFYRPAHDARRYADYTGCGNTLNAVQPPALRLITDSLRYWVTEMGVDGFRFDLAAALARGADPHHVDMLAPFLAVIAQDPILRQTKLIAEPWDVGPGGYQAGAFPPLWSEWNDRYRDAVRDFWRGALPNLSDLGYRLSGSSDLYGWGGRRPYASVNYVTAHDGFTLRDLVSYERKHNEANGEDNRDGTDDNRSWNCGAEGPSGDPAVLRLRHRQLRNLLATLLLSTGVPMLVAGDEMGRTQGGNNNAYCQDNETGWVDWSLLDDPAWRGLYELAAQLIALRRAHPVLRRAEYFTGQPAGPGGLPDLAWFTPDGRQMAEADWHAPAATVGMYLSGRGLAQREADGRPVTGESLLLVLHGAEAPVRFTLPGPPWADGYEVLADTDQAPSAAPGAGTGAAEDTGGATPAPRAPATAGGTAGGTGAAPGPAAPRGARHRAGAAIAVPGRTVMLLRALMPPG